MPIKLLKRTRRHYRRVLYLSISALSIAIFIIAISFEEAAIRKYHDRRSLQFANDRERIQEQVVKFSETIKQSANLYMNTYAIRDGDVVPAQKYAKALAAGNGVTVTDVGLTKTPFLLATELYQPKDQAILAENLRILRDWSTILSVNENVGVSLYGYFYSKNGDFFASSPLPPEAVINNMRRGSVRNYVNERIALAEKGVARSPGGLANNQTPIWMPADCRYSRCFMSRLVVPMYRYGTRFLTMSLAVPDSQFSQLFVEHTRVPGFFLFSKNVRTYMHVRPLSSRDQFLIERLNGARAFLNKAENAQKFEFVNGVFIITQRISGPEWVAVSVYTWGDIFRGLRLDFMLGAAACIIILAFLWLVVLYLELYVARPLLDSAGHVLESQNFGKAIVDTLPIGIGVYSHQTQEIVLHNDVAKKMLGLTSDEQDVRFYEDFTRLRDIESGTINSITEVEWDMGNGNSSYIGVVSCPSRFKGLDVIIYGMIDLNERKESERILIQAREAADRANRAKSMFLAIASHEIRTPLHGAIGHLELLCVSDLDYQQREWVEMIKCSFDSLLGLVNDLLDQAKLEANALHIYPTKMIPNDIVESCARNFCAAILQKRVGFYCVTEPDLDMIVQGDAQRLAQILQNLLGNAAKFTDNGEITLTARCLSQDDNVVWARFEVADTGIGISHAVQSSIFNPLTQADESITHRYGGTGLGLFLCRKLTELMDGRISVLSEPGAGSRFSVEIPFKKDPNQVARATPLPLSNLNVDLRCAIPEWKDALTRRLERWGASVLSEMEAPSNNIPHLLVLAEVDASSAPAPLLGTVVVSARGPFMPNRFGQRVEVTSLGRRSLLDALQELSGARIRLDIKELVATSPQV